MLVRLGYDIVRARVRCECRGRVGYSDAPFQRPFDAFIKRIQQVRQAVWLSYFDLTRTNYKFEKEQFPPVQIHISRNPLILPVNRPIPSLLPKVLTRTYPLTPAPAHVLISLYLLQPIPFQLRYPSPCQLFSSVTLQSGTIHRLSYRWSERAAIRNAPSNLSLMDCDADSGILPRSPLTDNTFEVFPRRLSTCL